MTVGQLQHNNNAQYLNTIDDNKRLKSLTSGITMSEREQEQETKVLVSGKLVPVRELEKQYPELTIAGKRGNIKVLEVLLKADKPLTREDVGKEAKMSVGYAIDILKKMVKSGYILEFQIGKGRHRYYLLTEKGVKFARSVVKQ